MISLSNSDIIKYLEYLEKTVSGIKEEIFKISWYMRGGVTANDLFYIYGYEDRKIMSGIIKENIDTTIKTKLSFV